MTKIFTPLATASALAFATAMLALPQAARADDCLLDTVANGYADSGMSGDTDLGAGSN